MRRCRWLLVLLAPSAALTTRRGRTSLVQPAWLRDRLDDGNTVVLDATQVLCRDTNTVAPARAAFEAERIPTARFLDVGGDLADASRVTARGDALHNMLPPPEQFARALGAAGVDDGSRIVLYSSSHVYWATRACVAARRPCRPGAFVDASRVLAAIGDVALVDTLKPAAFAGAKASRYGRRGHIPTATNLPYTAVVDSTSGRFFGADAIRAAAAAAGLRPGAPVLAY
ncbi:thiosulfate sulfurtransferase [Aureococcus anophagefferens]|nr:thiosulfate sulfurtransferase [Aureococcus anophagefferens]